jgi:excisionase family DNA binding protein
MEIHMSTLLARDETVVPDEADSKVAKESSRVLAAAKPEGELRVRLENGTDLVLPKGVGRLLSHLLTEMGSGNAVTLVPVHAEFTTQEAADYLNVSRPYLIKLLKDEQVPFHKTGTHWRIKFLDIVEYKRRQEAASERARKELAKISQELDMGY